jgi:hypothetical protein
VARTSDPLGRAVATLPVPEVAVFAFFSNRLGCLGSLLVSIVGTLILIVLVNLLF